MRARGAFSGVVASRDLSNGNLLLWSLWLEVDSTTPAVEGDFLELATSLIMSDGDLSLGRTVLSMLNITVVGYSDWGNIICNHTTSSRVPILTILLDYQHYQKCGIFAVQVDKKASTGRYTNNLKVCTKIKSLARM